VQEALDAYGERTLTPALLPTTVDIDDAADRLAA
jgi:hypothetical protein